MPHRHTTSTPYDRFYFLLNVSAIHTDNHQIGEPVQEEKCYRRGVLFLILKISEMTLLCVKDPSLSSLVRVIRIG